MLQVYEYVILSNMAGQKQSLLNRLENELPEGLLADPAWFQKHGYSRQLLSHYVSAGWLQQPTRGVYRRTRGTVSWQQVVISLQTLLKQPVIVGGRTALELQGYSHYLTFDMREVHLYGPKRLPKWVHHLGLRVAFLHHDDRRLFRNEVIDRGLTSLSTNLKANAAFNTDSTHGAFTQIPWGQWDWPLTLSSVERAYLEFLDEVPRRASFDLADKLMEGLSNLSPNRLQRLLVDCKSVKVKRLFFFFADRYQHRWLKRLDKTAVDFGKGKRVLATGGKFDKQYQITVPEELHALH